MSKNISKSLEAQKHAKHRIPGMSQLLSKRPDQFSLGVWPSYYSKAKGAYIWDLDNNKYLDMSISGIGANVLGYADDDVDSVVINAIRNGSSSSLNCYEEVLLVDKLCELHPWADMARFTRSGGEALAVAVRITRAYTKKEVIAFCGYHGWHDWYLAANLGSEDSLKGHLLPGLSPLGVPRHLKGSSVPFDYNDIDSLKKIFTENKGNVSTIIMEPIRNIKPEHGFLEQVRQIADREGAILVFDEVSAGFRLNTGGAHLGLGVNPDMAVFSKALGNGYPIAAVIGVSNVMQASQDTFISSTNWTERVGPVAALAVISKHQQENVATHLQLMGEKVQAGWNVLADKHGLGISVGGIAPLSHFSFDNDKPRVCKSMLVQLMCERGILASNIYYSMYAHTIDQVVEYLNAIDESFGLIAQMLGDGTLERKLKGAAAAQGFKRLT